MIYIYICTGQWKTTQLKEYPPALNKALEECVAHHWATGPPLFGVPIDPDFILCADLCMLANLALSLVAILLAVDPISDTSEFGKPTFWIFS